MLRPFFRPFGSRRRPRLVPAVAGLLLVLAGTAVRAAGDAPASPTLEEIKGDLKTIKRDNAAASQGTSLSKVTLPGLQTSPDSSSSAPARPTAAADAAPDGRTKADANWLLNGVELQTKTRPDGRPSAAGSNRKETALLDASDPTFMLRLYLAQPDARSAAEEARARDAASDPSAQPGVGSFDTFLSQWVSKRDPALRGLLDAAAPAGMNASGPAAVAPLAPPAPENAPAIPNPFLAAFNLDSLASAPIATAAAAPSPPAAPPALALTPAPADSPPRVPPAPPGNPTDDKKYFPQLNRF